MRTRIFTQDALDSIQTFVAQGENSRQIAERIGCTQKSLIVTCSKHKISLRRTPRGPCAKPQIRLALKPQVLEAFENHAPGKSLNLVERLLTVIARDDLIKAVLDEDALA
jgi:hypothetical protein